MTYTMDTMMEDFITEFGALDMDTDATDGEGFTYWGNWEGHQYFLDTDVIHTLQN